jgi:G3E family GTPase
MKPNSTPAIPICLVTGFLGSGKTTFLKHTVEQHRDQKLVYLVNEFSAHDIDGAIVSKENPSVVAIPGGSIFCKCLVTEFIGQLTAIPSTFDGVEGVVIEASGMANPKVIADMLRETKLDDRYTLATIVSIVDPGSFMKLRVTLPNIVAQIEAADRVIINKTDLYDAATLAETRAAVAAIKSDVEIMECSHANAEFTLFEASTKHDALHGEYAKCKDPNYDSMAVTINRELDITELQTRIMAAEDDLYRLKGYVPTANGTEHVEYSTSGFTHTPAPTASDHTLVLIMRGSPSDAARELLEWLR